MSTKNIIKRKKNPPIQITQKVAEAAKPIDGKAHRIFDTTVTGLNLYVGVRGSESWNLLYTSRDKKRLQYRIGSLAQYDATSAKAEARKLLAEIAKGNDPVLNQRETKAEAANAHERTLRYFLMREHTTDDIKAHAAQIKKQGVQWYDSDGSEGKLKLGKHWNEHLVHRKSGFKMLMTLSSVYKEFLDIELCKITTDMLRAHRQKRIDRGDSPDGSTRARLQMDTDLVPLLEISYTLQ